MCTWRTSSCTQSIVAWATSRAERASASSPSHTLASRSPSRRMNMTEACRSSERLASMRVSASAAALTTPCASRSVTARGT